MSSITLAELQPDIKARLAAHSYFAGVPIFIEDDASLTPEQEKQQADLEEAALLTQGLALKILSPEGLGNESVRGRMALKAAIGIGIVEDILVNRSAGGLQKPPLLAIHHAIAALKSDYEFPAQPFGGTEPADGLKAYTIVCTRECLIVGV